MHIHHRVSGADGIKEPVPGFVAGGPNPENLDEDCGVNRYPSREPALAYLDDFCSYSTNEVTINWNAPLVYVSGALQALSLQPEARSEERRVGKGGRARRAGSGGERTN